MTASPEQIRAAIIETYEDAGEMLHQPGGPWHQYLEAWMSENRVPVPAAEKPTMWGWDRELDRFEPRETRDCYRVYHIEALYIGDTVYSTSMGPHGPSVCVEEGESDEA